MKCETCGKEILFKIKKDRLIFCHWCNAEIKKKKERPVFGMKDSANIKRYAKG